MFSCLKDGDMNAPVSKEEIILHIDIIGSKIIDLNSYYDFQEDNPDTMVKYNCTGIRVDLNDFPEDICAMIQLELEEYALLEKLNSNNIDSSFSIYMKSIKHNFDKIKDLVLIFFIYADHNPKKNDSITQLLARFLTNEDSNMKYLIEKALIEVFMKFDSDLISHNVIAYNLCHTCKSDLVESIFFTKSVFIGDPNNAIEELTTEEARNFLAIFQTDNLNDFIEHTSINFDLSKPIKSTLFFERESCISFFFEAPKKYLIDLAAYNSAVQIFKYLLLNEVVISNSTVYYSIAGGNSEIIRLLIQNFGIQKFEIETSIAYHRNEIFHWLLEQKLGICKNETKMIYKLFECSIKERNLDVFLFLIQNFKIEIKEQNIYQSIESQSFIMYRILKLFVNNKYYEDELKTAIENKFHPVIRYILSYYHNNFIFLYKKFEYDLIHSLNYHECKAIVSKLTHIDESYDFRYNLLRNLGQNFDLTLNFLHNLISFEIDINEIEYNYNGLKISLLSYSILCGSQILFNTLISIPGVDVNKGDMKPFSMAARKLSVDALEKLIQHPDISIITYDDFFTLKNEIRSKFTALIFKTNFLKLLSTYEKTQNLFSYILMDCLMDFCSEKWILELIKIISDIDIAKNIVGSNGESILVIIASLCNIKAFKVLMDNDFKYVNPNHVQVFNILKNKRLENFYKTKFLKLEGFSALDITYKGSCLCVYNFRYANEMLQLVDLNVNSILCEVVRDVGAAKSEDYQEIAFRNLKLALDHPNLSCKAAIYAFFELFIGYKMFNPYWFNRCYISDEKLTFKVLKIIFERFKGEILSDSLKDNSILFVIKYYSNKKHSLECLKSIITRTYDRLTFLIEKNLYCYDQFIRYFRDLINIFMSPKRIKFLLSIVKEDDFESCVLMSLDEALKRIERGEIKDVSKYFFLFRFKNTFYNKLNIISRVVMISDFKVSISLLSFLSTNTDIDPNYVDLSKCENPPLHLAINENKTYVVILLLSFQNVNLRLKNSSGLTPLALCKQQNKKDLYSMIAFALLHNEEKFSIVFNKLIQNEDKNSEISAAKRKIFATSS